ncbi:MAG TPA: anti-sigma factor antagonist [Gammaproteobacteria bacterium]|nr:anti-sigma factor antagonist [Gammaproteobacteria bacterium]
MTVSTEVNESGNEVVVRISGRFDFDSHEEFGEVLEIARGRPDAHYIIDMADVVDIDSSALGMLLLLRDATGGDSSRARISRCNSDVRQELELANFQKLFQFS